MRIAIFTGGTSGERLVSIRSARNVQNEIDFAETKVFILPEDLGKFLAEYHKFDLAIPVIHGKGGEDGSIQGLLDMLEVPYLFSGIEAHTIAIDKKRTKQLASMLGYRTAHEISISRLVFPLFAKPRFGGSSVSSGRCAGLGDLQRLTSALNEEFLLEEPLIGKEFTVGVIEYNGVIQALPVIEIIPPGDFFDFESKNIQEKLAQEICPAHISTGLSERLQAAALSIHSELEVRHISRSDFIVSKEGDIYFLETNTIPGLTDTSLVPKMLAACNLSLRELLKIWCDDVGRYIK